jgi:hypothetical protein
MAALAGKPAPAGFMASIKDQDLEIGHCRVRKRSVDGIIPRQIDRGSVLMHSKSMPACADVRPCQTTGINR